VLDTVDHDDLLPDRQLAREQVDVLPPHAGDLPTAGAAQRDQPPQREQRIVLHSLQEPGHMRDVPHRDPGTDPGVTPGLLPRLVPHHRVWTGAAR